MDTSVSSLCRNDFKTVRFEFIKCYFESSSAIWWWAMNHRIVLNNWHFLRIVVLKWDSSVRRAESVYTKNKYTVAQHRALLMLEMDELSAFSSCWGKWKILSLFWTKFQPVKMSMSVFARDIKNICRPCPVIQNGSEVLACLTVKSSVSINQDDYCAYCWKLHWITLPMVDSKWELLFFGNRHPQWKIMWYNFNKVHTAQSFSASVPVLPGFYILGYSIIL